MALSMLDKKAVNEDRSEWAPALKAEFEQESRQHNGCVGTELLSETDKLRVWIIRLKPGERHMRQIGRVSADEVNSVATWLADLTRDRRLPQKMLLLHQFKSFMLEERDRIDLSIDALSYV